MKKIILTITIISGIILTGCTPTPTPAVVFPTESPTATAEPTSAPTAIPATEAVIQPTEAPAAEATEVALTGRTISISKIHMIDSRRGMAVGGDFGSSTLYLTTDDGGVTWTDMTPITDSMHGGDVQWSLTSAFYGDRYVWLMVSPVDLTQEGGVVVMYSTDGGSTFVFSEPLDISGLDIAFFVNDIQFVNEKTGWLLAHVDAGMNHDYIALYRTNDGGVTWQRLLDPYNSQDSGIHSCAKTGMFFVDEQNGYLTGTCNGVAPGALLFTTTDGGVTWQKVELPEPAGHAGLFTRADAACGTENAGVDDMNALHLTVSCRMYASDPAETLWFSYTRVEDDAGWDSAEFPGGFISYLTDTNWLAASPNWNISTDAGATWNQIGTQNYTVTQIQNAGGELYAVSQGESDARLYHSSDYGQTWQIIQPGAK